MLSIDKLIKIATLTSGIKDVALKHNKAEATFQLTYTHHGQPVTTAFTADQLCDYVNKINQ